MITLSWGYLLVAMFTLTDYNDNTELGYQLVALITLTDN